MTSDRFRAAVRFAAVAVVCVVLWSGCGGPKPRKELSSEEMKSETEVYRARVKHPERFDISAVQDLFRKTGAPMPESLQKCDFDYRVETVLSRSIEDLFVTLPEHVRADPERYHWCFYAKILELDDSLSRMKAEGPEAQKKHLFNRYRFFVYLARIYEVDLGDPRYLDFARRNYQRLMKMLQD